MTSVRLTRRGVLRLVAGAAVAAHARPAAARARALLGALRWDAWYAPGSSVTAAVERSLTPPRYQPRLPFFASVDEAGRPHLPAISQPLMDLEIAQALYAGLDYWAFVAYPASDPMTRPLDLFLSSTRRGPLRFCMFTGLDAWGTAAQPSPLIEAHLKLMAHEAWQRVEGGRPLYFLGFVTEQLARERWGGLDGLRDGIARFRARAREAGAGDPYIVAAVLPRTAVTLHRQIGADAASAYSIADGRATGDFATLARIVEAGWQSLAGSGLPVVPTVMAGWDRRPRVEAPVPWEKSQRLGAGLEYFFEGPSPTQLSDQVERAFAFVDQEPQGRRAPAVLVYAWNENDEGGWLVPTRPCDQARLQALHRTLKPADAANPPGCAVGR
ncbi:MAG: hypothetical protein P4M07_11650 [Xanthobacteraceae bacterium]|nr:hypothetical protein [Xanthobacteraceae bacterium]